MCCVPILIFIPVYVNIGAEIDVAIWSSYELSTKLVSGPDALGSEFDTLYVAGISQSGFHSLIRPNRYGTTGLGRDNGNHSLEPPSRTNAPDRSAVSLTHLAS